MPTIRHAVILGVLLGAAPALAQSPPAPDGSRVGRRITATGQTKPPSPAATGTARPVNEVAMVKAQKADKSGNLVFRRTARNFNPAVAMAGKVTIVEVEEIVETGSIDPDAVHLPGIYVQRVLPLTPEQAADKRIERRTVTPAADAATKES